MLTTAQKWCAQNCCRRCTSARASCFVQKLRCKLSTGKRHFRKAVIDTIAKHYSTLFSTLRFYIQEHIFEDFCRFGMLVTLNISPFEHYHFHIKTSYPWTPKHRETKAKEVYIGLQLCSKRDKWGWTSTQAVSSAARGKPPDASVVCMLRNAILSCMMRSSHCNMLKKVSMECT